jgi:hypothetical protein
MNLNIPTHFHVHSKLFMEIYKIAHKEKDNTKLGEEVRRLINEYSEGKHNPPPTIELDE